MGKTLWVPWSALRFGDKKSCFRLSFLVVFYSQIKDRWQLIHNCNSQKHQRDRTIVLWGTFPVSTPTPLLPGTTCTYYLHPVHQSGTFSEKPGSAKNQICLPLLCYKTLYIFLGTQLQEEMECYATPWRLWRESWILYFFTELYYPVKAPLQTNANRIE